ERVREVPPEGAGAVVNARLLQIPDEAKKELAAGQQALDARDVTASIAHLQKAVELAPNFAEAYQLMGGAYLQLNNLVAAKKALEQAIIIDGHLAGAHLGLGICLNTSQDFQAAERELLKALALAPSSPEGHFEIARTYFAM